MDAWWTEQTAVFIGAIGGGGLGALGGVVGAMSGTLAMKARCRGLVVGLQVTIAALGVLALLVGIVAKFDTQPWHVTFPLLLGGGVLTVACGCLLPLTLMIYAVASVLKQEQAGGAVDARQVQMNLVGGMTSAGVRRELVALWGPGGWLRQRSLIGAGLLEGLFVLGLTFGIVHGLSGLPWVDWAAAAGAGLLGAIILTASALRMRYLTDQMTVETERHRLAAAEFRRT
ncbi:MAG: hypothetical protein ACT4PL_03645 [Phycisphaerales bacterium]